MQMDVSEYAASLFLEFLARNNALYRDDNKIISDGALVAITLMIAESRPEEKDIMVNLVMNFLTMQLVREIYYLMKLVNRSLPKYLANFPNFTGIPACALAKQYVFSLIFALMR